MTPLLCQCGTLYIPIEQHLLHSLQLIYGCFVYQAVNLPETLSSSMEKLWFLNLIEHWLHNLLNVKP